MCKVVRAGICPLVFLGRLFLTFASITASESVLCTWLWGKSVAMSAETRSCVRGIDNIHILYPRNKSDAIVIN